MAKAKLVIFKGFDGRSYKAVNHGRQNGITVITYQVRINGKPEMVKAYLEPEDAKKRLCKRPKAA